MSLNIYCFQPWHFPLNFSLRYPTAESLMGYLIGISEFTKPQHIATVCSLDFAFSELSGHVLDYDMPSSLMSFRCVSLLLCLIFLHNTIIPYHYFDII